MASIPTENGSLLHTGTTKIGKLVVLPWAKATEIAIKSIRVRFWRSMITISSIILAIAFLMSIWTTTCVLTELIEVSKDRPTLKDLLVKNDVNWEDKEREKFAYPIIRYLPGLNEMVNNIGTKDKWLIVLSLLVCVVGIVNAMLMSVTERFREIGTMKCLGALDKFIIRIFLLESSGLGILGTLIGIILGFSLAMVMLTYRFNIYPWKYFPAGNLIQSALVSLVVGTVLSIIAAIYPASVAAKMEPVSAMRVEE